MATRCPKQRYNYPFRSRHDRSPSRQSSLPRVVYDATTLAINIQAITKQRQQYTNNNTNSTQYATSFFLNSDQIGRQCRIANAIVCIRHMHKITWRLQKIQTDGYDKTKQQNGKNLELGSYNFTITNKLLLSFSLHTVPLYSITSQGGLFRRCGEQ